MSAKSNIPPLTIKQKILNIYWKVFAYIIVISAAILIASEIFYSVTNPNRSGAADGVFFFVVPLICIFIIGLVLIHIISFIISTIKKIASRI